jgi:hypothetical protein
MADPADSADQSRSRKRVLLICQICSIRENLRLHTYREGLLDPIEPIYADSDH